MEKKRGSANKISEEQFKRIIKVVSFNRYSIRDQLILLFSYGLGLRAIEMAALKINDILDYEGKVKEHVLLKRTKGNHPREIYIVDKRIQDAIHKYIEERKKISEEKKEIYSMNGPLFLSQKGYFFSNKTMARLLKIIYIKAGVDATSHSGRRTFATNLIENGADIKSVQVLLGHSRIQTTIKYVEKNPDRLKKVILNALY